MYTIQQVANQLNIPVTKLRFYAKEGIFPYIKRDSANTRLFDDADLEWVHFAVMLRKTVMTLKQVKQYEQLAMAGDETISKRYTIVSEQKIKVLAQIDELHDALALLNLKMDRYDKILKGELTDQWNPQTK